MKNNITIGAVTTNKFTRTSDSLLAMYQNDIRRYPILSREEERNAFAEYRKGNESAKETIIKSNLKFVLSVAMIYGNDENIMDCISEGNIGLLEALDRFDETLGYKFGSYAVAYIRMYIGNYIRRKMVTNTIETLHSCKINKIKNAFLQANEREITNDELADVLESMNIVIKDKSNLCFTSTKSISGKVGGCDDDDATYESSSEFSCRTASRNEFENEMDDEERKYAVNRILKRLTERERVCVEYHFGLNGRIALNNDDLGKVMGLGAERCRQIVEGAIAKLGR